MRSMAGWWTYNARSESVQFSTKVRLSKLQTASSAIFGKMAATSSEDGALYAGINAVILPNIVDDAIRSLYHRTFVRDILLSKPNNTQTIDDRNPLTDPLTFPLLFPTGEQGWRPNILRKR